MGAKITELCRQRGDYTIEISRSVMDSKTENRQVHKCNLSNLMMVMNCIERLKNDGPVDNFFWVAGEFLRGEFRSQDKKDIIRMVDVNFRNALFIAHEVWQQFQYAGSPKNFVTIASVSGIKASSGEALYDATKHAQVGFTRSLGVENKDPNIHVSLFLPSSMKTDMWKKYNHPNFDSFLEPEKVAAKIMETVDNQKELYTELVIPRGSL